MRSLLANLSIPQRVIAAVLAVAVVAIGGGWVAGAGPFASATPTPEPSATPSPAATATPTQRPTPTPTAVPTPEPTPVAVCPLNGLALTDPSVLDRTALAVQIENHPAARPARNLSRADMVYEATVEGDITRFTAIFLCRPTEGLTGPIRSARYYNIDLWQDLGVLTVGYGASNGALTRFSRAGMPYVNGITGAWPWYTRYGPRAAPHNLYGDIEAVRAALGKNAALDRLAAQVHPLRPPLSFDPAAVQPAGRDISSVEIRTTPYWRIGWRWDAAENKWQRLDAGVEIMDEATDEPVMATSVLVQLVIEEVVYGDPDPAGNPRRLHHLVGSGHGVLYVDGSAIDVNWSRPTADAGTTWTYAGDGEELLLPPGVVWWEIVPVTSTIAEVAR